MWGIKKWPRKILHGAEFGATIINDSGVGGLFLPLGIAAALLSRHPMPMYQKPNLSTGMPEDRAMKQWWVQIFIIPNLRSLAAFLRFKDADSTGADDEAARAIDIAIDALEKWLAGG